MQQAWGCDKFIHVKKRQGKHKGWVGIFKMSPRVIGCVRDRLGCV